jgi:DNA-binding XRE family transcriptional regulator
MSIKQNQNSCQWDKLNDDGKVYKWLGAKFSKMRKEAGIKQRDVALKVGITPTYLYMFEKGKLGKRKIQLTTIRELFATLGREVYFEVTISDPD